MKSETAPGVQWIRNYIDSLLGPFQRKALRWVMLVYSVFAAPRSGVNRTDPAPADYNGVHPGHTNRRQSRFPRLANQKTAQYRAAISGSPRALCHFTASDNMPYMGRGLVETVAAARASCTISSGWPQSKVRAIHGTPTVQQHKRTHRPEKHRERGTTHPNRQNPLYVRMETQGNATQSGFLTKLVGNYSIHKRQVQIALANNAVTHRGRPEIRTVQA